MDTQETIHLANQKVSKNHTSVLFILIVILVIVAVVIGYMRLMEKQAAQEVEKTKKVDTVTEKTTPAPTITEQPKTTTPSDEVTDIEADLKTTDVSF